MIQRIKQLYDQCFVVLKHNTPNTGFDPNKFAELIVRACVGIVEETRWMVKPTQEQIARSVRQHFRVEE